MKNIFCWGCDCAALQEAATAWCLFYNSSMNEWCNHAGGKHHCFVRTGKKGLERWEVYVNIHQVPSTAFQLLLKRCLNKFTVKHCCSDTSVWLQTILSWLAHMLLFLPLKTEQKTRKCERSSMRLRTKSFCSHTENHRNSQLRMDALNF